MTPEPRCSDPLREQLPWYLNGSLEGPEARAFEAHLETCDACSADLRDLSPVSAAIDRHGVPLRSSDARRFRVAAALAAGLLLPALAGIYWGSLGFPRRASSGTQKPAAPAPLAQPPAPRLETAVLLDLTAANPRGPSGPVEVRLSPGASSLVVAFRPPLEEGKAKEIQLRDASGAVLTRLDGVPQPDRSGRAVCVVPVALVESPGDYALVFIGGDQAAPAEYSYPFRVRP